MTIKIIQQRKRIFIAGEGESEQSFSRWLQQLSEQQGLHVHLDCQPLGGGGYQAMLTKAVRERTRKERYKAQHSILLVDSDRADRGDDPWTIPQLRQEASAYKIDLCVQTPKLEGLLLRMLKGNERLKLSVTEAHSRLCKEWEGYQKPAGAQSLASKFSLVLGFCLSMLLEYDAPRSSFNT